MSQAQDIEREEGSGRPLLERQLGLSASFSMITGSMLGIGIFLAPCLAARHISTSGLFFGAWIFTGMIALTGAWIYAQLGVMLPRSGGDYVFHREAMGSSVAFSYGWGLLSAAFAGSLAAMSVALCAYQLLPLLGLPSGELWSLSIAGSTLSISGAQLGALALIGLITLINTYGLGISAKLQQVIAYLPLVALFMICAFLFTSEPVTTVASKMAEAQGVEQWSYSGISNAFLEIYFAYSGWNAIIYVAGEIKEPKRTIPLALIGGTITVMCLYLFFCAAALHYVGLEGLRGFYLTHTDLGSGVASELGGGWISTAMTALVTVALLASINATVIGGGRLAYMMSNDGCFWRAASEIDERYGTPNKALWILAMISGLITIMIPYDLIFRLISLVMVLGGLLTTISYYILKLKHSAQGLSASDWVLPPLFMISSLAVIAIKVSEAIKGDLEAILPLIGIAVILIAFCGHRIVYSVKS